MVDCPRFCSDCPLIPKGVTAELTSAQVVTRRSLNRYVFAHDAPELADHFAGQTRIKATVLESRRPDTDVGDEATMLVEADGKEFYDLIEDVRNCSGAVRNRIQRLLHLRGRCGVFRHREFVAE